MLLQKTDQIHFVISTVKFTFFEFPFAIDAPIFYETYFRIPDLLTLAAIKAFALGGRGKWKDYVDLYFILKHHHTINEICTEARNIFKDMFNPLLFIKQLCYFDDISFEEEVEFRPGYEIPEKTVKDFLINAALSGF